MTANKILAGLAALIVAAAAIVVAERPAVENSAKPATPRQLPVGAESFPVANQSNHADDEGNPTEILPREVAESPSDGDVIELGGSLVGKRVVIENCRPAVVPAISDGATDYIGAQECDRNVHHDEPYDSMMNQDLEILAESDAAAALVLGDRLAAEEGAAKEIVMRLYLHALALSAHPDAFDALYEYINGGHGVIYTDGELNLERTNSAYVWSSVGSRLGYMSEDIVSTYREALIQNGQNPDQLDAEIEHWTTVIAERRQAVGTGGR